MNLLILYQRDFISENLVSIEDKRLLHIRKVLKISSGDFLNAGLLNGPLVRAELVERKEKADIFYISYKEEALPPPIDLILLLALPRPKVLRRLFFSISSLGIKKIYLLNTFRVEKSYWQSPVLEKANMEKECIRGLEQAKDTILPEVYLEKRFRPFVEDRLPELVRDREAYLAHPYSEDKLIVKESSPSLLAIGPEGGFIDFELDLLKKAGLKDFSLGERILSVETAVPVLISKFIF